MTPSMRVLITGGAGFVGTALARALRRDNPAAEIVAFDNLRRRGSELNLPVLNDQGVAFVHGDIRSRADLEGVQGNFDVLIEASAEPSVLAGLDGSTDYVVQTNLVGAINALEFARERVGLTIFLSTSRVYSVGALRGLPLVEEPRRFALPARAGGTGWSAAGISESFSTSHARSLYGATKLAAEMFVQEYAHAYGVHAVINRCGVIAGPGQFGKVDQGVFTLWVAHHHFGLPLRYTGFGGSGKQVRDLLHPEDLYDLIVLQMDASAPLPDPLNVGGGVDGSVSLAELTSLCQESTGNEVDIGQDPTSAAVDIPWYVTDAGAARERYGWEPTRTPAQIVSDIAAWIADNEPALRPLFATGPGAPRASTHGVAG